MDNRTGDISTSKPTESDLSHARGVLVHVTDPTDPEVTDHFWVFHLADHFDSWDEVHRLVPILGRGYAMELVPQ